MPTPTKVEVVFRNGGHRPWVFKNARTNEEAPLEEFSAIPLKITSDNPFIRIDMERRLVWVDFGDPEE